MRETLRQSAPARREKYEAPTESTSRDAETVQGNSSSYDGDVEKLQRRRKQSVADDDPFGDESGEGTKYRTLKWWQASMIMIAETISLGILSLPSVLATVGIVPGVILVIGLGFLATYTGFVIGQFKLRYPGVHNMADAGEILFKPLGIPGFGREFLGAAQTIFLIFSMASHVLTWTIAFNTITGDATCTIVWSIIGIIIFIICDLPRTLKAVSFLAIASGHVAFFSFISEFEDPKEFPKALWLLQATDISIYVIVAWVVYRYAGPDVASPALGSTGVVVSKVAYGIALPTIVVAGVIYGHVSTKYVYVRLFRGTKHMAAKTWYSYLVWGGIVSTFWVIAWIIAESIPVFNDLLSLISALFASWFTYGLSGIFWLFLNRGRYTENWKKMALTALNSSIFLIGAAICGIGLYASGTAIHADSGTGHSWSCTPNPN